MVSTTTFADLPALAINDVMRRLAAEKKLGPFRATARGHSDASRLLVDTVRFPEGRDAPSVAEFGEQLKMFPNVKRVIMRTGVTNVEISMHELPDSLEELDLSSTTLKNIDFVKPMTSLKKLKLNGCYGITDFSPLMALESLEHLEISDNRNLKNLSSLKAMSASLKSLWVSACNKLTDISALAAMTGLETLVMCAGWAIADFRTLSELSSLTELVVNCNHFGRKGIANETLAAIAQLENLEVLELKANSLVDTDIMQLAALKGLEELDLSFNAGVEKETIAMLRSKLPTTDVKF